MTTNNILIARKVFPKLADMTDESGQHILEHAKLLELPRHTTVFHQGDPCHNYLLVIEGSVRVFTRAENGREVVLYRVNSGCSCVLTTSCLLANTRYPAEGVCDTDVKAFAISSSVVQKGMNSSRSLREFVFASLSERLATLITVVENISFTRIDQRLAKYLLKNVGDNNCLETTHQELAMELGTAREVISRQLKEFEHQQLISIARGKIDILQAKKLSTIANEA